MKNYVSLLIQCLHLAFLFYSDCNDNLQNTDTWHQSLILVSGEDIKFHLNVYHTEEFQ